MTTTLVKPPALTAMPISPMWWSLQKAHGEVFRWGTYTCWNSMLPKQSNLAHINGLTKLAEVLLRRLAAYSHGPQLDHGLMMLAIGIHDDPEALLRRDVCYYKKTGNDDLDEFRAFAALVEDNAERMIMLEAFLLQFVTKDFSAFDVEPEAMKILNRLRRVRLVDAKLFNAFQRLDYVEYAQMCWDICKDPVILTHVFRNQAKPLETYGYQVPGFQEFCWTKEHVQTAQAFMDHFKDMPDPDGQRSVRSAYEWARDNGHMPEGFVLGPGPTE